MTKADTLAVLKQSLTYTTLSNLLLGSVICPVFIYTTEIKKTSYVPKALKNTDVEKIENLV